MELHIGHKIKVLRQRSDLTQEELANRAGLTKGFISQLENEQSSIQIDSLADLLEALGVSLSEFFADGGKTKVVFAPSERAAIDGNGASVFEMLIPGSTHNMMDPIFLQLQPGESLQEGDPHEGEQFGYVLKGTATLSLDGIQYKVPNKHCFYFKADQKHQILNNSNGAVSLLWVTSPPQM